MCSNTAARALCDVPGATFYGLLVGVAKAGNFDLAQAQLSVSSFFHDAKFFVLKGKQINIENRYGISS